MINKLFKNLYKIEEKKHSALYVFGFAYYLITMIMPSIILTLNKIDHGYFTMNYYYPISIIILATINGYTIFKYLYSKPDVDFLHSLPANRNNIFYSKLIFGINVYLFPTLISILIEYFVLLYIRPDAIIVQSEIIKMLICNILFYILCLLVTSLCVCISGKHIFAIFLNLFWHISGYLLILTSSILTLTFNKSINTNHEPNMIFGYLSPYYTYDKIMHSENNIIHTTLIIIYIIILFRLCKLSFQNRKLENYNKAVAFESISKFIQIIVSIVFGLLGGETLLIFYEYDITNLTKLIILIVGVCVFSTVTFIVIDLIYHKKIVFSFSKIIDFILSLLVPIFIVVLYTYVVGV